MAIFVYQVCEDAVASVVKEFGGLDILVLNAAEQVTGSVWMASESCKGLDLHLSGLVAYMSLEFTVSRPNVACHVHWQMQW